jgi:hypothetical protein
MRHSIKKKTTKTNLSRKGISLAHSGGFALGKKLGKETKVKLTSGPLDSESKRTHHSARFVRGGLKRAGVKSYPAIRVKADLAQMPLFIDAKAAEKILMEKFGGSEVLAERGWMEGKFKKTLAPPRMFNEMFARRLAVAVRTQKIFDRKRIKGKKRILLLNVTHSWQIDAFIEELTGRSIESFKPPGMIRPVEGVFFEPKKGKMLLSYRGENFDITNAIKKKYPWVLKGIYANVGPPKAKKN